MIYGLKLLVVLNITCNQDTLRSHSNFCLSSFMLILNAEMQSKNVSKTGGLFYKRNAKYKVIYDS